MTVRSYDPDTDETFDYIDNRAVVAQLDLQHKIREFLINQLNMLGYYFSNEELEIDVADMADLVNGRIAIAKQNEPF